MEYSGKVLEQIQCSVQVVRVHKQCSSIRESLRNCNHFICKTCSTVTDVNDSLLKGITIDGDEFETVSESCYLGDIPIFYLLRRLSMNLYLYSRTKVYHS